MFKKTLMSLAVLGSLVLAAPAFAQTNVSASVGIHADMRGKIMGIRPVIQGNGQPIVAGTLSAVNGNTLTITTSSNVTYTVDATNAKIVKSNTLSALSSLTVGDKVVVQGTVNGTSVTAYSVIDASAGLNTKAHGKLFGRFGQFFQRLFGF